MASNRQASRFLRGRLPVLNPGKENSRNITSGTITTPERRGLVNVTTANGSQIEALTVGAARSKDESLVVPTGSINWVIR